MSASVASPNASSRIGLIGFGAIGKALLQGLGAGVGGLGPVLLRPASTRVVPGELQRVDDVAALIAAAATAALIRLSGWG